MQVWSRTRILASMQRVGVVLILILAFSGVADSAYLAESEASGTPLVCGVNALLDCNKVVTSPYSSFFGVSTAQYGVLFYGIMFVLAALELVIFAEFLRRTLMWVSFLGVAASLYLALVQVFVIDALCIYCLASTAIAFSIFVLATLIHVKLKSVPHKPAPLPRRPFSMPPAVH